MLSALGVLGVNPAVLAAVNQMGVNVPGKNTNSSSAGQRYDYGSGDYSDATNLYH